MPAGDELKCKRCGNTWYQKYDKKPKVCSGCKSPFWQKELTGYWKKRRNEKVSA